MRILLIHWKPAEASERIQQLKAAGFDADLLAPDGSAGLKGTTEFAKAILIDLSRLPLQGRALAIELRKRAGTRRTPLVFMGGAPEKVEAIRQLLPDAAYLEWAEVESGLRAAIRNANTSPLVPDTMAGYSGTPLPKKLGIRENTSVGVLGAPDGFEDLLEPLPPGVTISRKARGAMRVVVFTRALKDLERYWQPTVDAVAEGATIWIAWPKKASGVPTDLTETQIRAYGLERGWVDYKICAIDAVWSGLAFALRKKTPGA